MSGRITSSQAAHYRQLAYWTSDERTHNILLEMARELDARVGDELPQPCDRQPLTLPRSLN